MTNDLMEPGRRAERYARALAERYGDSLVSVALYGSAARGDYREGVSDLNLLVILKTLDPSALRQGTDLAREWVAEGNPPPLLFSEAEWHASADVFPIEYGDIREAHRILHGSDPFDGVRVDWEHLRLQTEHEIKSRQIQLREQYLLLASDPDGLGTMLVRSFSTFLALFRAALRLAGSEVPRDAGETLDTLAQRASFDPAPFREVRRARESGASLSAAADAPLATGYLASVAAVSAWLDGLARHP